MEPLGRLVLSRQIDALLNRLREIHSSVAKHGPNTKAKREALQKQIEYFEERREMMCYDEYHRADLVLATGVIEGACRYVVGERLDDSGMRWTLAGAEPLLQLRWMELNGDWEPLITWAADEYTEELKEQKRVKVRRQKTKPASRTSQKQVA